MFRLAAQFGRPVSEMETMPRDEFIAWQAYYQLEPFGSTADDYRTELQLNLMCLLNTKPGTKIPRFIDHDPKPEVKKKPTRRQLENNIRSFMAGRTVKAEAAPLPQLPAPDAAKDPSPDK